MRRRCLLWLGVGLIGALVAGAAPALANGRGARAPAAPDGETLDSEALARQAEMLGIAPARLRNLQADCRRAGFTAEEFERLLALVTRAKLTGLPHQQLLNKLDEGLAKGALPERVLRALEMRARYLRDAKEEVVDPLIMQGWRTPDYALAVGLVADALGAGASAAELVANVRHNAPCAPGVPDVRTAFVGPRR